MAKITAEQTESFLRRARREKGADYVDPGSQALNSVGCRYFKRGGAPSCIVGHVFYYAGVQPFSADDPLNKQGIPDLWPLVGDLFTDKALSMLERAQNVQDTGGTWGTAVKEALDRG